FTVGSNDVIARSIPWPAALRTLENGCGSHISTAPFPAAQIRINEPRPPQHTLRFADAGEPPALRRPGASAPGDAPAGTAPRSDGGDAGRRRVRRRGVSPGHAGLLPRGGAGPQPLRSGGPHQAAASTPFPDLAHELRAIAGHGAGSTTGPGPAPARQAVRRR